MVIAEETGHPGEVRVRFKAPQRDLLLDELELYRSTAEDGIEVVSERVDANPAYLDAKQQELEAAQTLIAVIVGTMEPGDDFEVIGPAYLLCSCVRSATGLACERLSHRVDELRPGLDSESATREVREHQQTANTWLATLLATNGYEPVRLPPPECW